MRPSGRPPTAGYQLIKQSLDSCRPWHHHHLLATNGMVRNPSSGPGSRLRLSVSVASFCRPSDATGSAAQPRWRRTDGRSADAKIEQATFRNCLLLQCQRRIPRRVSLAGSTVSGTKARHFIRHSDGRTGQTHDRLPAAGCSACSLSSPVDRHPLRAVLPFASGRLAD